MMDRVLPRGGNNVLATAPSEIHPIYDPVEKLWFVEDCPGIAEPSLHALTRALPSRVRVKDYYPEGYVAKREGGGRGSLFTAVKMPKIMPKIEPPPEPPPPPAEPQGHVLAGYKVGWERILRAAPGFKTAKELASSTGTAYSTVKYIIAKAHSLSDSRVGHLLANDKRGKVWTAARNAQLLELASQGLTGKQIAEKMGGHSRSSIIAQCMRLGTPLKAKSKKRMAGS